MCGRASLTTPDWETIRAILDAVPDAEEAAAYTPRYNVAPTQLHPILRVVDGQRRLQRASWGLPPIENRALINARVETVASRPMWQEALAERRCVVPVDGFFEWQGEQPYWFHRPDGGLLLLAGLWEPGPAPQGQVARARFVVVTCAPNALVAAAHDRMPAILPPVVRRRLAGASRRSTRSRLRPRTRSSPRRCRRGSTRRRTTMRACSSRSARARSFRCSEPA